MRIFEHPILGPTPARRIVRLRFEDRAIEALEGEPIAAALMAAGIVVCRTTAKKQEPRGVFCGIGRCTDCLMIVDGEPNIRTCVTPVREDMEVRVQNGHGDGEDARCDTSI